MELCLSIETPKEKLISKMMTIKHITSDELTFSLKMYFCPLIRLPDIILLLNLKFKILKQFTFKKSFSMLTDIIKNPKKILKPHKSN